MSGEAYRVEGLRVTYAERTVLRVGEMTVHEGEFFGIVGPSGAGKSTLLRVLGLLEQPTAGSIWFLGAREPVRWPPPLKIQRQVTMVFQRPLLLSTNVYNNVAYGLRLRGNRDARDRVLGALEQVGLSHMARESAQTLSGGELQRVALARALVLKPSVLLLDEPTANLDPHNVSVIESALRELRQDHQTTIVMVTHNVFQAKRLADRVLFILNGECVETADKQSFFASPQDPRTMAFVRGEMVY